mmetsp:Transcript_22241/g.32632  ORF Transcript_22241/g.32632 Transcript_22241/m.32632 type:complete len:84 (-) Transcript_22241:31-282(-)
MGTPLGRLNVVCKDVFLRKDSGWHDNPREGASLPLSVSLSLSLLSLPFPQTPKFLVETEQLAHAYTYIQTGKRMDICIYINIC